MYVIAKDVSEAAVGEELLCECEPRNTKDRYAIATHTVESL